MALVQNHIDQWLDRNEGSVGTLGSQGSNANSCVPHRPARVKTTRIDWESVRLRYCWGVKAPGTSGADTRDWPSLAEVAKEFGASLSRVEAVSARDHWPGLREDNQRRLRAEVDRQMLASMAAKQVRARVATFMTAMRGLEHIEAHLKREGLSAKDLGNLFQALRLSQEVAETAAGTWTGGTPSSGPAHSRTWP